MALVTKNFSDIITFTRASTGTYFDSAGVLQSAAINAPRFDYDPSTLAAQGLLIEEARTNSIRNNTMQGAAAGTPGTLPTNWVVAAAGGLVTNVIGTGTTAGITWIDVQIVGTASATVYQLSFDANTAIAASAGQAWTGSFWVSQVGGTTSGITATNVRVGSRDSGGATIGVNDSSAITLTFTLTRYASAYASLPASTSFVQESLRLALTNGAAIDITLRIGLPQLELGAFATSVIPTTTTALTRNADQASVNTLSPWFNSTAGTLYAEAQIAAGIGAAPAVMAGIDDTTINNRIQLRRQSAGAVGDYRFVSSGGNFTGTATSGTLTSINKQAGVYAASDQAGAVNGTLMTGIVSVATIPTITRLALGDGQGSTPLNGWLRRVVYYPRRLSNAELQAITA